VKVTGAPVLLLNDGGTAKYDAAKSTSTALAFDYTVAKTQKTADLSVSGIELGSPSAITDIAGNNANLSGVPTDLGLGVNIPARMPTLNTLASFNGTNGLYPAADLIADAAGDLFGTTSEGGAYNDGTVFEIAKTGGSYASTPTTLINFNFTNGLHPATGLVADAAGDLFGTTEQGANGRGTVFETPRQAAATRAHPLRWPASTAPTGYIRTPF
jgi:uncharacterized repeat protein (TIGR03803 family)